jgi:hypothetical protein
VGEGSGGVVGEGSGDDDSEGDAAGDVEGGGAGVWVAAAGAAQARTHTTAVTTLAVTRPPKCPIAEISPCPMIRIRVMPS